MSGRRDLYYAVTNKIAPLDAAERRGGRDVLLVLLLLVLSGNPAVPALVDRDVALGSAAVVLGFCVLLAGKAKALRHYALPIVAFGLLLLSHVASFSFFPYVTVAGFWARLMIAFSAVLLVYRFHVVYVRAMSIVCLVSLLFTVVAWLGLVDGRLSAFNTFDMPMRRSAEISVMGVHTFLSGDRWDTVSMRNSGMFWEPGAMAGYTTMALVLLAYAKRHLPSKSARRHFVILNAGVLSTMSTGGYICLPFVWLLHAISSRTPGKPTLARLVVALLVVVPVACLGTLRLPFMGAKIRSQLASVRDLDRRLARGGALNRFQAARVDLDYIRRRPLAGWGLHPSTRFALHGGKVVAKGATITDFLAKWGLLGEIVFWAAIALEFWVLSGRSWSTTLFGVVIFGLTFINETFRNHPAGLAMLFCAQRGMAASVLRWRQAEPKERGDLRIVLEGCQVEGKVE